MTYQLGIDIGTTFTAAAVTRPNGRGEAEIVALGSRSAAVSSVLFLGADGTVLVGEAAERRALSEPDRVVRQFKRRIGDDVPLVVGGQVHSAQELGARMVRWVLDQVVAREGGPPRRVCLTHPASWGSYKHDLMRTALQAADVRDVTFLAEPQAAAVAYAAKERTETGRAIAVYDLGGGTFDAATVRKTGTGSFELLGRPEGIERLGGVDFDEAVFSHVRLGLGAAVDELDHSDPNVVSAVARLRRECVEAKEALSADTAVTIPVLLPELRTQARLTRTEFEAMIRASIEQTVEALRRAVRSADVPPEQLASVLLVGGSSRIPLISQIVSQELGRPVAVDSDPKTAIAVGAALSLNDDEPRNGSPVAGAVGIGAAAAGGAAAGGAAVGGALSGGAGHGAPGPGGQGPGGVPSGAAPVGDAATGGAGRSGATGATRVGDGPGAPGGAGAPVSTGHPERPASGVWTPGGHPDRPAQGVGGVGVSTPSGYAERPGQGDGAVGAPGTGRLPVQHPAGPGTGGGGPVTGEQPPVGPTATRSNAAVPGTGTQGFPTQGSPAQSSGAHAAREYAGPPLRPDDTPPPRPPMVFANAAVPDGESDVEADDRSRAVFSGRRAGALIAVVVLVLALGGGYLLIRTLATPTAPAAASVTTAPAATPAPAPTEEPSATSGSSGSSPRTRSGSSGSGSGGHSTGSPSTPDRTTDPGTTSDPKPKTSTPSSATSEPKASSAAPNP